MFETLAGLPGGSSATVLRQLSWITVSGLPSLIPGRVKLAGNNEFKVFAPKKQFSVGFADGVIIHGFWNKEFDGIYYIHKLHEIREGKRLETGEYSSFSAFTKEEPDKDFTQYREMPLIWLEGQRKEKPWAAKADEEMNFYGDTNATMSMYMEETCFYQYVWDIYEFASLAKEHGTHPPWPSCSVNKPYRRRVFDSEHHNQADLETPKEFIDKQLTQTQNLVFVHFKDEQDVLSHAQEAFLNMMSLYLTQEHDDLSIIIADVIVRDAEGAPVYETEWQEYFADNMLGRGGSKYHGKPSPFVMVLGHIPQGAMDHLTFLVRKQGVRLLDFDLFHECRDLLAKKKKRNREANDQFRSNLKRAMHEIWRVGGMLGDKACSTAKDYRGLPESMVETMVWDLEYNAVVIKIHTQRNGIADTALTLCNHLKSAGCPYVEVVIADGPEDRIEVHDDTDTYSVFSHMEGNDALFWNLERVARRMYAGHKLNGASPLLMKPDVEKGSGRDDQTPEIFSWTRKPLH